MTPITRLNKRQAMKHLGISDHRTFDKRAQALGFNVYPGLRGDEYSLQDITAKWNMTKAQLQRKLLSNNHE